MIRDPQALGSNSGAGASLVITTSAAVPAHESVVLTVFGRVPSSVTDSAGNTYSRDGATGFPLLGPSTQYSIWSAHNITALPSGGTITLSGLAGAPGSTQAVAYFVRGVREGVLMDATYAYVSGTNATTPNASTNISVGVSARPGLSAVAFGLLAIDKGDPTLTITSTGWTALSTVTLGSAEAQPAWRTATLATFPTYAGTMTTPTPGSHWWAGLMVAYPARVKAFSLAKGADGRLVGVQAKEDGRLQALLYNDATPPAVASTATVIAAGNYVWSAQLLCRRAGIWDLAEVGSLAGTGEFDHWRSRNQGATWTRHSSHLGGTAPWSVVTACYDPSQSRFIWAVYETDNTRWLVFTGIPFADGWTYTNYTPSYLPNVAATAAAASASLVCRPDGRLLLGYVNTSREARLRVCALLDPTGTGTWTDGGLIGTADAVTLLHTVQGALLAGLWDGTDNLWRVAVGTKDAGADTYTWGTPAAVDSVEAWETASLVQMGSGAVWFSYLPYSSETPTLLRNPAADLSGSWS